MCKLTIRSGKNGVCFEAKQLFCWCAAIQLKFNKFLILDTKTHNRKLDRVWPFTDNGVVSHQFSFGGKWHYAPWNITVCIEGYFFLQGFPQNSKTNTNVFANKTKPPLNPHFWRTRISAPKKLWYFVKKGLNIDCNQKCWNFVLQYYFSFFPPTSFQKIYSCFFLTPPACEPIRHKTSTLATVNEFCPLVMFSLKKIRSVLTSQKHKKKPNEHYSTKNCFLPKTAGGGSVVGVGWSNTIFPWGKGAWPCPPDVSPLLAENPRGRFTIGVGMEHNIPP